MGTEEDYTGKSRHEESYEPPQKVAINKTGVERSNRIGCIREVMRNSKDPMTLALFGLGGLFLRRRANNNI